MIADTGNYLIRKVNLATVVGNNNLDYNNNYDDGYATSVSIHVVKSLTLDRQEENLFFSDNAYQIRKVNLFTNIITKFAELDTYLDGLNFDASGNYLYYTGYYSTNILTTVAGNGGDYDYIYNGDNMDATSASFFALHLTLAGLGNIFFSDYMNQRIRKIDYHSGLLLLFSI
jgi:hypothetical protein